MGFLCKTFNKICRRELLIGFSSYLRLYDLQGGIMSLNKEIYIHTKTKPEKEWKRIWIGDNKTEFKIRKNGDIKNTRLHNMYTKEYMESKKWSRLYFDFQNQYNVTQISYFRVYACIFVPIPDCMKYFKQHQIRVCGSKIDELKWTFNSRDTSEKFLIIANKIYEYLLENKNEKFTSYELAKMIGEDGNHVWHVIRSATFDLLLKNEGHPEFLDRLEVRRTRSINTDSVNNPLNYIDITTDSKSKKKWKRIIVNGIRTEIEMNKHGDCRFIDTKLNIHKRNNYGRRLRDGKVTVEPIIAIPNTTSSIFVDRAVASLFIPIKKLYKQFDFDTKDLIIYHKDGNTNNCNVENLEWRIKCSKYSIDAIINLCEVLSNPEYADLSIYQISDMTKINAYTVRNVYNKISFKMITCHYKFIHRDGRSSNGKRY